MGHPGRARAQARREHAGWANALFGGWTVSTIVQARSGPEPDAVLQRLLHDQPVEHRQAARRPRHYFCCAWRPDQVRDPNAGGSREAFFNPAAYAIPADGKLGNAKKGSLKGPGTWVANFGFYKDVFRHDNFRLQFSALLDNAFNHPQFFAYGSGFVAARRLPDQRRPEQRSNRCARGGHDSNIGGIRARTGHTTRHTSRCSNSTTASGGGRRQAVPTCPARTMPKLLVEERRRRILELLDTHERATVEASPISSPCRQSPSGATSTSSPLAAASCARTAARSSASTRAISDCPSRKR